MRVVVDTNVLVSAVLHDRIPQHVILFVAETLGFEWMASPEILVEYRDVLRRPKFGLPESIINAWFEFLSQSVTIVEVDETIEFPRDRADAKFLACALFSNFSKKWGMGVRKRAKPACEPPSSPQLLR
ncbi:MAG: putative toxin-antitoxin system toxin component, PIN family, partial [Chloroflexi bacterium]